MTFYNRIDFPAYYNDFDEGSVAWLAELMKQGHIPPGEIDRRSILDVCVSDLRGFRQCHFFAGIGGWAYALRLAGVPVDLSLWTGSPPCQPFSVAGRQEGREDERHLAPHFVDLVRVARPGLLLGEQVASAEVFGKAPKRARGNAVPPPDWAWIDDLSDRLEAARYAIGANDFPSAGVGAPHIRQRTYFGAVAHEWLEHASRHGRIEWGTEPSQRGAALGCGSGGLADLHGDRRIEAGRSQPEAGCNGSFGDRTIGGLGNGISAGLEGFGGHGDGSREPGRIVSGAPRSASEASPVGEGRPGPTNGFWGTADWLFCRDERFRPVEPGTFPLVDGLPGRVGLLRGYGNAINPQAAAQFIQAFFEALESTVRAAACEQVPDSSLDGLIV
ncbi:DNA methylase [Rhodobacter phage RcGingersnap]|nr:DNA methylase [Rhodobacter phage RcGingersnap]UUV43291.1 DNA methylase [Rhodobacter phage RcDora]